MANDAGGFVLERTQKPKGRVSLWRESHAADVRALARLFVPCARLSGLLRGTASGAQSRPGAKIAAALAHFNVGGVDSLGNLDDAFRRHAGCETAGRGRLPRAADSLV